MKTHSAAKKLVVLMWLLLCLPSATVVYGGDALPLQSQTASEVETARTLVVEVNNHVQKDFLWLERLTKWHSLDSAASHLQKLPDAEKLLRKKLGTLHDEYTRYANAKETEQEQKEEDLAARKTSHGAKLKAVSFKTLNGGIGYIRIRTFHRIPARDEVKKALQSLQDAPGYIIDVEDNGGGMLDQGFAVFSMFVDEAKYAIVRGRENGKPFTEELQVARDGLYTMRNGIMWRFSIREPNLAGNKPVVIIANGDTASASEMFINAMLEAGRARVIGTKTFGKGIAQSCFPLPGGGSLCLTTMRVYAPSGKSIHKIGIFPNRVVKERRARIDAAIAMIKQRLGS